MNKSIRSLGSLKQLLTRLETEFVRDLLHVIWRVIAAVLIDSGEWALQSANRISTPTLIAHGSDDRITCHHASLEFADKSLGKATTTIWPGGKHDLHHDIVRDEYFASLLEWINDVSGSRS